MNNNWSEGEIRIPAKDSSRYVDFKYQMKHFEEPSEFGIDGGRVSKLFLRETKSGEIACNYDRGWDIEPTSTEAETAYKILIMKYN